MEEPRMFTDLVLVVIANLANLLIAAIFVARHKGFQGAEYWIGLVVVCLGIPVVISAIWNLVKGRETWTVYLPLILVLYLVIEFVFDYWLKIDFRSTWLMWPYILVFYAGLMAMIGYSFLVNRTYGFVTLSTYFINLATTVWAHSR